LSAEKIKVMKKGPFNALVKLNKQNGECFYRLDLEFEGAGADAFAKTVPGQFAEVDLSRTALPSPKVISAELKDKLARKIILRRPFSFCDIVVNSGRTTAELLYRVVGPATLRMTTLKTGDSVSVIGPLGNGFSVPKDKKLAVLVAGGMGSPPVQHLANVLARNYPDIEVIAIAGAKTKNKLPFDAGNFSKCGTKCMITTDDGSAGLAGFVTVPLEKFLDENHKSKKELIIYGCGPEEMLAKVAGIANSRDIDCQISMERMMACGFGICQGCAVECRVETSNETIYKMCCTDGPVFDSKEIVFSV